MLLAERFAEYVYKTSYEDFSEEIIAAAKERILDTVGAALAGAANWESREAFLDVCQEMGEGDWAAISAGGRRYPLMRAAMINGTLAHAIELDDGHKNAGVHAGAAVVMAALTLGAGLKKTGKEILTAIVLGYDITYRLAAAMAPYQIQKGFHPSGNDDTIGVMAVAGKLMGLDEKELANGFGLSALYASGLMEATVTGQSSKCIQVGNATANGIAAAMYGKAGLEGTLTGFEGKTGFLRAKSQDVDAEAICEGMGKKFLITDTYSKLYPTCRHSQPAIEAVLDLCEEEQIRWEDVERVWVGTHQVACDLTGVIREPKNSGEAKFSLPYGVALALHEHAFGVSHLEEKYTKDPVNLELANRVTVVVDPEVQSYYPKKRGAKVEVSLKNGKVYKKEVYNLKGSPSNPVGWDELEKKFRANAGAVLNDEKMEEVIRIISTFDEVQEAESLMELLY